MIILSPYNEYLEKCRKEKKKFVDEEFPPNGQSLNYTLTNRNIVWKRVTEIVPNAIMGGEKIDPCAVQQGHLNDCYFLACISAIAEVP
jgi:hypothetical protein